MAPTLQYGVGVQDLLLNPGVFPTDGCQVLEDQLGALSLPGPGLSTDDDALVLPGPLHQGVAVVSDSEDVRRELSDLSLPVELDLLARVDR